MATHNGRLAQASASIERGLGIRVLVRGSWGYVGISEPNRHDVAVAAKRAVSAARAAAILQDRPVDLTRQEPQRALFRTKIRRDPLGVPLEDKVELLLSIDEALRGTDGVIAADAHTRARRLRKIFVSSDGSELDQELVSTGVGYRAGALHDGDVQYRSFAGGPGGLVLGQGWELVGELPLVAAAEEVAREAVELSRASPCPSDVGAVVLTAPQLAHHTLGTTVRLFELDRMIGLGAGETGGSFLGLDGLGGFELGAPSVNLSADAREMGGPGTFGYDDEGVDAQRVDLVTGGRFTGVLSGRESAARVGLEGSTGCVRASDWSSPPTVWPTNVSLAPGDAGDLDALVADTKQGVLLDGPRGFSVDPFGRTFTATAEVAWTIEGGKRGRMLKNPVYQGSTVDFWRSCDALCGDSDWSMYGALVAPRGRARRTVPVGVGAPSGRFSRVSFGAHDRRPSPVSSEAPIPMLDTPGAGPGRGRKTKSRKTKRKSKRVRKKDTK